MGTVLASIGATVSCKDFFFSILFLLSGYRHWQYFIQCDRDQIHCRHAIVFHLTIEKESLVPLFSWMITTLYVNAQLFRLWMIFPQQWSRMWFWKNLISIVSFCKFGYLIYYGHPWLLCKKLYSTVVTIFANDLVTERQQKKHANYLRTQADKKWKDSVISHATIKYDSRSISFSHQSVQF